MLRINGVQTSVSDRLDLETGGFITPTEGGYLIGWQDGSFVRVLRNPFGIDTSIFLAPEREGTVHGLLGPFTKKQGEMLVTKAGKIITKTNVQDYHQLYRVFGDSWRIGQAESLFDYAAGTSTATYQKKDFPDPNPPKLDPSKEASNRETCLRAGVPERALAGCILDVAITGEAGFAMTTAAAMGPPVPPLQKANATLACTKDQGDPGGTTGRDLSGYMWSNPTMTNLKCQKSCAERGFVFAGTQYGSYCFCGNRYGQFGPATNCDMRCSGDTTETCGGPWANSVSGSGAKPTTPKSDAKSLVSP